MKRIVIAGMIAGTAMLLGSCASHPPATEAHGQGAYGAVPAAASGWPLRLEDNGTDFTVFEPQVDWWDGHQLAGRCALAVQGPHEPTAHYGVFSFTAITLVDKPSGTVKLVSFRLTSADFPSDRDQTRNCIAALIRDFPQTAPPLSLESLQGSLNAPPPPEHDQLGNVPPKIILATNAAVLVYIDGPPALRPVAGTDLQRVINTRLLMVKDASGRYYLHLYDGYLEAPSINGPWIVAPQTPAGVAVAQKLATETGEVDLMPGTPDPITQRVPSLHTTPVPQIFTATTPTELIQFRGAIQYAAIPGTDLLYAINTSGNLFRTLKDQENYVLISGRWYRSASLDGPWRFVPGNKLPGDFANIPDDSPKENVKASVPGTLQASEALIANSIPESTEVARTNELAPPQFDGAMQLAPIEGTPLQYVVNSPTPIIEVEPQSWYACDNGVWYSAASANGPWTVATSVPAVIYSIPPSSPLHYLTYVQVYGANPETVYEGYTPGYLGTEVAPDGTVVYGTGYDYSPWIGSVWYGPPVTYGWGFDDCWTPWWGWGFGCGFGWGFGLGWGWGGCYPPRPWWGGFGHWHHGDGDGWWHGANHAAWASANADVYGRGHTFVSAGSFGAHGNLNGYGQAYNSRTGWLQAGQTARMDSVAGRSFAYNTPPSERYGDWGHTYIAPRFGELNRGYQTYPRGAWYGSKRWSEIPGTPFQRDAAASRGSGGIRGGFFRSGGFSGGHGGGFGGHGGGFGGGHGGGGGGHR